MKSYESKPIVPLTSWKKLHEATAEFIKLEPWKAFNDTHLFGIQDPASGSIGYCAIMGSESQFYGFVLHRGDIGLLTYLKLIQGEYEGKEFDFYVETDCLRIELCSPAELESEEREILNKVQCEQTNLAPCFRSNLPNFTSWYINEEEAEHLTFCMKAVCRFVEEYKDRPDEVTNWSEFSFPLCVADPGSKDGITIKKHTVTSVNIPKEKKVKPYSNMAILDDLKTWEFPQSGSWELDTFLTPMLIHERGRPFPPKTMMIVHADTKEILCADNYDPIEEDLPCEKIATLLINTIQEKKILPNLLPVTDERLHGYLQPICEALNIEILLAEKLHVMPLVQKDMAEHMR
jgi:hypothetical protein